MRKYHGAIVAPLLVALALGRTAPARADDKAVRKELEAIYARYVQAFKATSPTPYRQWLERYLAANAVNKNPDGSTQTRQQLLDALQRSAPRWLPARQATGKIVQLTVNGNKATVLFTDRLVRLIPDRNASAGAPRRFHQFVVVDTERDTWVKSAGGWKTTTSVNLPTKMTLDGKPFRPPAARAPDL